MSVPLHHIPTKSGSPLSSRGAGCKETMKKTLSTMNSSGILVFSSEAFGSVRTLTNEQGETFFVGKDVARALGYSKSRNALAAHVEAEDKKVALIQGPLGGAQKMTVINESGLYALILSSQLPSARAFKRWVTQEVLPQIRRTGGYIPTKDARTGRALSDEEIVSRAHEIIGRTLAMRNAANENCVTATEVATAWGITAVQLNGLLQAVGIIERRGGRWHLVASLEGQGLAEDRHFFCYSLRGLPRATSYLVWTPEGVRFLEKRVRWLADALPTGQPLQLNLFISNVLTA